MVELQKSDVQYSSIIKDSIHSLTYIYGYEKKKDTVLYVLKESKSFEPKLLTINKPEKDNSFSLVNSTSLWISGSNDMKGKEYKVYQYASNYLAIDGCVTHFWVPQIGIILKRNTTWRYFSKLRTNNDSINRQIELLADVIFQDKDFYTGCQFEIPEEKMSPEKEKMIQEIEKSISELEKE